MGTAYDWLEENQFLSLLPLPLFVVVVSAYGGYAGAGVLGLLAVITMPTLVWIDAGLARTVLDGRGPYMELAGIVLGIRLTALFIAPIAISGYGIGLLVRYLGTV